MKKEKQTSFFSDEDWKNLLPGKVVKLGSKSIRIKPFVLEDFIPILSQIISLQEVFVSSGITQGNFMSKEKLPDVVKILKDNAPEIISVASGIPATDVARLPISPLLALVDAILDVNLESQEGLAKNLQSLVAKMSKIAPATQKA